MIALVGQKKLDSADELWLRCRALFTSRASEDEIQALIRDLKLAHPLQKDPLRKEQAIWQLSPALAQPQEQIFDYSDPWRASIPPLGGRVAWFGGFREIRDDDMVLVLPGKFQRDFDGLLGEEAKRNMKGNTARGQRKRRKRVQYRR